MQPESNREVEVREVLIEAVEVQLAALKAAITFWSEWVDRASAFVKTAASGLETARSTEKSGSKVLLELVDAGRESIRTLTELPRNAAAQFVRELDDIASKRRGRAAARATPPAGTGAAAASRPASRPAAKRRVRTKS
jgi:hypothetical protein